MSFSFKYKFVNTMFDSKKVQEMIKKNVKKIIFMFGYKK